MSNQSIDCNPVNNLEFLFENHTQKLKQPSFKVKSGQIEILQDPIDFYIQLNKGVQKAKKRIGFSALYIGSDPLEQYLAAQIDLKIKKSKKLKVTILQDYFRGTRRDRGKPSSLELLQGLKTDNLHNKNVKLAFFRAPGAGKNLCLKKDSAIREIFGLQHQKFYIFDNDVILTGANLSQSYFCDRTDRYYYISNAPELANYLDDFQQVLSNNCYQANEQGTLVMLDQQPEATQEENFKKVFNEQFKEFLFLRRNKIDDKVTFQEYQEFPEEITTKEDKQEKNIEDDNEVQQQNDENTELISSLEQIKEKSKTILQKYFDEQTVQSILQRLDSSSPQQKSKKSDQGEEVQIFPAIQIPTLKYEEDAIIFRNLLNNNLQNKYSQVKIATGYMNFTEEIKEVVSHSKAQTGLLTAAPQANGFFDGGKVKKYIPYWYRVYEYKLLKMLQNNKNKNVKLYEYANGSRTFHIKGIWCYEPKQELPSLTAIGSSNYGPRSSLRDNEMNFYIYSKCSDFNQELHAENKKLYSFGEIKTIDDVSNDPNMKLGIFVKFFAKAMKSFL